MCEPQNARLVDEEGTRSVRSIRVDPHLECNSIGTGPEKSAVGKHWERIAYSVLPLLRALHLVGHYRHYLGVSFVKLIMAVTQPLQLFAAYRSAIAVEEVEGNPSPVPKAAEIDGDAVPILESKIRGLAADAG